MSDDAPLSFSAYFRVYSQASIVGNTVYISAQTGQDVSSDELAEDFLLQLQHTLQNLQTICEVGGGSLTHIVKLDIFLLDLATLPLVEKILPQRFADFMPACTVLAVNALPHARAQVAIGAVMVLPH
jgi:enamine deaminase RidA (YjgF/YER057c/UK114 family)